MKKNKSKSKLRNASKFKRKNKPPQSVQQSVEPSLEPIAADASPRVPYAPGPHIIGPHPLGPNEMLFYWTHTSVFRATDWPLAQHPYGHWEEAKFDELGNLIPPPKGILFVLEKWEEEDREKEEKMERERREKEAEAERRKLELLKLFRESFVGARFDDDLDEEI